RGGTLVRLSTPMSDNLPYTAAVSPHCTAFAFQNTSPTATHTLSLHDALPISGLDHHGDGATRPDAIIRPVVAVERLEFGESVDRDRKSTRLNSSHVKISYAVFCLKKKKQYAQPSTSLGKPETPRVAPPHGRHL